MLDGQRLRITTHANDGRYVDGDWVRGSEQERVIFGSLLPLNERELDMLPEGWRRRGVMKLYTHERLRTLEVHGQLDADRLLWENRRLLVASEKNNSDTTFCNLAYFRYIVIDEEFTPHGD